MRYFLTLIFILATTSVWAKNLRLEKAENVRILVRDILEVEKNLPKGTLLFVDDEIQPENHDFRNSQGKIERSSNGFYPHVIIKSIPESADWTEERIRALNAKDLWITATLVPEQTDGKFPAVSLGTITNDYTNTFEANGKPKLSWSPYFQTRFPGHLNETVTNQSEAEITKWTKIFAELQKAGERTVETSTEYLYMNRADAMEASIAYEQKGEVQSYGAWTIAVQASAVRHGFPNVPCAEFMSELLKQAYKRAGYDVFEDFNLADDTYLGWDTTSAVVKLADSLYNAGWIPWELVTYKVPTGAIMAHFRATTPGHVYMAAGFDGRLIVDNGSPGGRKLFHTTDKILRMMYLGGVFFLPPGIVPEKWE